MKKNKAQKYLTNEHLLKGQENNFSLAEAAIKIAHQQIDSGQEFSLEGSLNAVMKKSETEVILEDQDQDQEQVSEDS